MAGGFIPVERPAGAVDIENLAQADYALERALQYGDYGPLLERLRAGTGLPVEQKLLVDIYEGKVKRPRGRPKQHPDALRFRDMHLALCVLSRQLKGSALKAAVADTATEAGLRRSAIYAAVEQHGGLFRRCGLPK